jgi:hypothetical protein
MSSSPIKGIWIPAVITSSIAFSALTLPFASIQTEPLIVEIPPVLSLELQPIFDREYRDTAIRYIGFSIIFSVISGVVTAEVLRARQSSSELAKTQEQLATLQQKLQDKESQLEAIKLVGMGAEIATNDIMLLAEGLAEHMADEQPMDLPVTLLVNQSGLDSMAFDEIAFSDRLDSQLSTSNGSDVTETSQVDRSSLLWIQDNLDGFTSPLSKTPESLNGSSQAIAATDTFLTSLVNDSQLIHPASNSSTTPLKLLDATDEFQYCRVKLPHLQYHRFAIFYDGCYFCLARVGKTKQKALELAANLTHKAERVVITCSEKGCALWVWQPDAYLETAA